MTCYLTHCHPIQRCPHQRSRPLAFLSRCWSQSNNLRPTSLATTIHLEHLKLLQYDSCQVCEITNVFLNHSQQICGTFNCWQNVVPKHHWVTLISISRMDWQCFCSKKSSSIHAWPSWKSLVCSKMNSSVLKIYDHSWIVHLQKPIYVPKCLFWHQLGWRGKARTVAKPRDGEARTTVKQGVDEVRFVRSLRTTGDNRERETRDFERRGWDDFALLL